MPPRAPSPTRCTLATAVLPSPLGRLHAAFGDAGLVRLAFGRNTTAARFRASLPASVQRVSVSAHPLASQLAEQLAVYFEGRDPPFTVPLDLSAATPFRRRVWAALRDIPFGETASYAGVARRIGQPGAARAVGGANGANPLPIIVPCHRVVRASGALGGYGAGLDLKRWLLRHEGIDPGAACS